MRPPRMQHDHAACRCCPSAPWLLAHLVDGGGAVGWWHASINLGETVGVSGQFVPLSEQWAAGAEAAMAAGEYGAARDSNSGCQLLLPPAKPYPMFASWTV